MSAEPDGWRRLWRFGITPGLAGAWMLLALALMIATSAAMLALGAALHPDLDGSGVAALVIVLLSMVVTMLLHEAVHALVYLRYGVRPRFGAGIRAGMGYLYVSAPGRRLPRSCFLLVALAPLIVLDLVGLALMLPAATAVFGGTMVVANTGGAIGDIWITAVLLQAPRWVHLEDLGSDMVAWAPPAHAVEAAATPLPVGIDVPRAHWVLAWLTASIAAVFPILVLVTAPVARHTEAAVFLGPLEVARGHANGFRVNVLAVLLIAGLAGLALVAAVATGRWLRRARRPVRDRAGPAPPERSHRRG